MKILFIYLIDGLNRMKLDLVELIKSFLEDFDLENEDVIRLIAKYMITIPLLLDEDLFEYWEIAEAIINADKENISDKQWVDHINRIRGVRE